jgi:hypothetical protein
MSFKLKPFVGLLFLVLTSAYANNQEVLSIHRTNYYPEKTYTFEGQLDSRCRWDQKAPLIPYFRVVNSRGAVSREALSGRNRALFSPKIKSRSSREVEFTLEVFANDLFQESFPREVVFKASSFETAKGCETSLSAYIDGRPSFRGLKRIEAKLSLNTWGFLRGHPNGLTWLKFIEEDQQSTCLLGNCL